MKKFLFLAVAFVAGFTAMAQTPTVQANASVAVAAPPAKADDFIKLSAERHDFGKIKQGVPVTTNFIITNKSDKPVMIEQAWASCGCTTPEYSKEPIAPGGTTVLKVGYNAASVGHFDKDVNIKLAGVQDTKIAKITGDVVDANAAGISKTKEVIKTTVIAPVKSVASVETKTTTKSKVKVKKVS